MRKMTPNFFAVNDINYRLVNSNDLPMTLSWRNEKNVLQWFKNTNQLTIEDHISWFEKYTRLKEDAVYIAYDKVGFIGQLSIYNICSGEAEVGRFIASPERRGRGVMKKAIRDFIYEMVTKLELINIYLDVKDDNLKAIGLYESIGFHEVNRDEGFIRMKLNIC